ncbi:MAG: hypothetical protein IJT79_02895 [Ruminococcus sp.]|nr:hypothetical protein [Ruminococcus sp.]
MNRFLKLSAVLLCLLTLMFSVPANAAGERITTSNVKVKTDRLFEVKIGFKSNRTITAARFTLTYNKNDIEAREPVCDLSRAQVRYVDKNGSTEIIFLCSDGVKCVDFPTLFSMKYKKISGSNTSVKITARDCVDGNLKNFTPPASALCNVYADGKSGTNGKSAGGSADSDDNEIADSDIDGGDILYTSGNASYAGSNNLDVKGFNGEDDPAFLKYIPVIILAVILLFLGFILYQNFQLKKAQKRREENNENNNKD